MGTLRPAGKLHIKLEGHMGQAKKRTEGHPEQVPARKNPHSESMSTPTESPTTRMSSLEETLMAHQYQNVPSWVNHDDEMADRMPPLGRTSAS